MLNKLSVVKLKEVPQHFNSFGLINLHFLSTKSSLFSIFRWNFQHTPASKIHVAGSNTVLYAWRIHHLIPVTKTISREEYHFYVRNFVRILELMPILFRTPHVLITWVSAYEKGTFRLTKLQDNRKKGICFMTVKGEIKNSLLLVHIQEFTTSIVQWTPYTYFSSFGLSNKFSIFQIDRLKET